MLVCGSVSCHCLPSANATALLSCCSHMKRKSQRKSLEKPSQKKRGAGVFLRECPILFSNEGGLRWRHFLQAFPVQRKRDLEEGGQKLKKRWPSQNQDRVNHWGVLKGNMFSPKGWVTAR